MADLIGHNLGEYRIIESIDSGGMGEVYPTQGGASPASSGRSGRGLTYLVPFNPQ